MLAASAPLHADIIRLTTGSGDLGDLIDETNNADIAANMATFNIPGLNSPGLGTPITFSITAITGNDTGGIEVNGTATQLGINSDGPDTTGATDLFDADLGESFTFEFGGLAAGESISISQLDFRNFSAGEVFQFGSQTIANGDLSNGTTDIFDFATPLLAVNGDSITIGATSGSIGIEAFELTVNAAVPEPSSVMFLTAVGVGAIVRRLRRKKAESV